MTWQTHAGQSCFAEFTLGNAACVSRFCTVAYFPFERLAYFRFTLISVCRWIARWRVVDSVAQWLCVSRASEWIHLVWYAWNRPTQAYRLRQAQTWAHSHVADGVGLANKTTQDMTCQGMTEQERGHPKEANGTGVKPQEKTRQSR